MRSTTRRSFLQKSAATFAATGIFQHAPALLSQPFPTQPAGLRFGVNYVPRKHWWYCWSDWDQQSVSEDLRAIADLGMDHVRVQCLWPIFQPGINYVSDAALERLHALLDEADRAGLDVQVTLLNGWMSGFAFMPAWAAPLVEDHNIFTHPDMLEAEKLFIRRTAQAIAAHPRFLGFDLGNELGVLMKAHNAVTPEQADAWAVEIFRTCDEVAPGKFHVNGVDHRHWFADCGFSRKNLATTGQATVVHGYAYFTGALKRFGYSGAGTLHLLDYMIELAYAYHEDPRRSVWVEEVGASAAWMPEEYMPEYASRIVHNAAETGKAWGITWWCSHDLDHAIQGFDSLEYSLGLIGRDNKPKPLGKRLSSLAGELRGRIYSKVDRQVALVVPDVGFGTNPAQPEWKYGDAFMKLVEAGKRPSIVVESKADDQAYLRARGITEFVRLPQTGQARRSPLLPKTIGANLGALSG